MKTVSPSFILYCSAKGSPFRTVAEDFVLPEQLLLTQHLTFLEQIDAEKNHLVSPAGTAPGVPRVLSVSMWPQADLSQEQKGIPGEVVTTE